MATIAARRRLVLALTALALAWLAQYTLGTSRSNDGWLLYAAAILLFVFACADAAPVKPYFPEKSITLPSRRFRIGMALAVALGLAALMAFLVPTRDDWGWALHLCSMGSLLIAVAPIPLGRDRVSPTHHTPRGWAWLALALILLLALAVRVWRNDAIPPGLWFDEAREGVVARQMLADPSYRPVYVEFMERPAHHAYLIALSFAAFGQTIAALRLVPAVFGVLNVLAAYLLFGRWFGWKWGLFAAALWAVLRYDLTFSRIVFDADTTPFFILMALYWLDRGLPRRDVAMLTLVGFTVGMGLAFYLPIRLFAMLLAGLVVLWLAREVWHARSSTPLRAWLPVMLWVPMGAFIAIGPVAEFALRNPDVFFNRNTTASIFYERAEPDLVTAIANSTLKHLAMFNVAGDVNGRHNLPGLPMLDPLTGALFLLGFGLALRRRRDVRGVLMLLLFAVLVQAGILSTDFEAPQALRSIGVLPAVVYCVVLSCVALAERLSEAVPPRPAQAIALFGACVILAAVAYLNLDTYFNRQETDPIVWKAHSPGETWAASEMMRLAATHAVVLGTKYQDSATIRFLAPGITPAQIWSGVEPLPSQPFVLFVESSLLPDLTAAHRAYPQAIIRELAPPGGGDVLAYEMIVD